MDIQRVYCKKHSPDQGMADNSHTFSRLQGNDLAALALEQVAY